MEGRDTLSRISLPRALAPFRSRQYRLLSGALIANLAGSGMWLVTSTWQLIEAGAGLDWFGAVAMANTGALALTALLGGVTADRVSPRRVIAWTGSIRAVAVLPIVLAASVGALDPVHLVVAAAMLGAADGFFYPAYSALVPTVVAPAELLATNGVESMLRPVMLQAAGPAAASTLMALGSPAAAFAGIALLGATTAVLALRMRRPRRASTRRQPSARSVFSDLREGFGYVARVRWLVLTLVLAVTVTIAYAGPVQVLLPIMIADRTGSGPEGLAFVLAGYGLGGILGSLIVSSLTLPRRYLTFMILAWGLGCMPLAIVGLADALPLIALALLVCGMLNAGAGALWGTVLQRRVPRGLLGRVSSLDFFVSLSAAPVSAALVVPAAEGWGMHAVFLVAGLLPLQVAILALTLGRLRRDEIDHPPDNWPEPPEQAPEPAAR